jgi:hypothetical protein
MAGTGMTALGRGTNSAAVFVQPRQLRKSRQMRCQAAAGENRQVRHIDIDGCAPRLPSLSTRPDFCRVITLLALCEGVSAFVMTCFGQHVQVKGSTLSNRQSIEKVCSDTSPTQRRPLLFRVLDSARIPPDSVLTCPLMSGFCTTIKLEPDSPRGRLQHRLWQLAQVS